MKGGPVTVYKVEHWCHNTQTGQPSCFEIRYYQSKQKALAYGAKYNLSQTRPQPTPHPTGGFDWNSWIEVYEMVPASPVEIYQ